MSAYRYQWLDQPTAAQARQIIGLYRQAGWWNEPSDDPGLAAGLVGGSHCFRVALADDRIIGMGRAISDGVSDAYIQDVTVTAAMRDKGVATRIVSDLIDRLKADGIGWIGLIAEQGSRPFYERFGFVVMANADSMVHLVS